MSRKQLQDAIELLSIWQTHLGSSRDACDEAGKRLWDRIEATKAATRSWGSYRPKVHLADFACGGSSGNHPPATKPRAEFLALPTSLQCGVCRKRVAA